VSLTIGIDPGQSGAIAIVTHDGGLFRVLDMPVVDKDVNPSLVAEALRVPDSETWEMRVVIENVHSMPKQGVASSFKFGKSFGIVLGVVAALGCPVELVTPTTWKRAMKVTADKETSRRRAIDLWPGQAQLFARKKDNGRAEAALIARWAVERRAVQWDDDDGDEAA
jgi:Holliday junction resolvasome RuvABC endonuclease subunit